MKKILHKLAYAQNPSQAHPSYYEEILCKVLTVWQEVQSHGARRGAVHFESKCLNLRF